MDSPESPFKGAVVVGACVGGFVGLASAGLTGAVVGLLLGAVVGGAGLILSRVGVAFVRELASPGVIVAGLLLLVVVIIWALIMP
jgi:hypothetical protein